MITMKKAFDKVGRILILCLFVALPCTITEGKTKNPNSSSQEELQMLGEYKKLLDIGAIN